VYRGSRSGLVPVPAWSAIGGQEGAQFGHPVAGAGDVNGDGFDDLIVGSERYANGEELEGAAFVFYSGPAGGTSARRNPAAALPSPHGD